MSDEFDPKSLDNPVYNFSKYFGIGSVKTVQSFFGVPTLARKLINEQTIFHTDSNLDEHKSTESTLAKKGFWSGCYVGIYANALFISYSMQEFASENYLPAGVWAFSNFFNLGHELMRLDFSCGEKLEKMVNKNS